MQEVAEGSPRLVLVRKIRLDRELERSILFILLNWPRRGVRAHEHLVEHVNTELNVLAGTQPQLLPRSSGLAFSILEGIRECILGQLLLFRESDRLPPPAIEQNITALALRSLLGLCLRLLLHVRLRFISHTADGTLGQLLVRILVMNVLK